MKEVQEYGYLAEQEFIKILNIEGIPYEYLNSWVDFKIYDNVIDVKSCMLSHKCSNNRVKNQSYRVGRFDLTETQREKEVYLALFVRFEKRFLFLGILKSEKDSPRYITIHKVREYKLLSIKNFIKKIQKENGKQTRFIKST